MVSAFLWNFLLRFAHPVPCCRLHPVRRASLSSAMLCGLGIPASRLISRLVLAPAHPAACRELSIRNFHPGGLCFVFFFFAVLFFYLCVWCALLCPCPCPYPALDLVLLSLVSASLTLQAGMQSYLVQTLTHLDSFCCGLPCL